MSDSSSNGLWDWQLVRWIMSLSVMLFTMFIVYEGFTEEGVRQVIAWAGKLAALCFCMAFIASAFHQWYQGSASFWMFRNRRYLGITFAILHLIHLASLVVLQLYFHPVFELAASISLFAGGMAYVFIILMLLTSFQRFSKYLTGRQWKILHTIGGYWIWFIFFKSYFDATLRREYWDVPIMILFLVVLGFRIRKLIIDYRKDLKLR